MEAPPRSRLMPQVSPCDAAGSSGRVGIAMTIACSDASGADPVDLVGTWKLVSYLRADAQGKNINVMGEHPALYGSLLREQLRHGDAQRLSDPVDGFDRWIRLAEFYIGNKCLGDVCGCG